MPSRERGGKKPSDPVVTRTAAALVAALAACSGTLPPRQQEVLQLKFQNDLSYQQISEITELSVSNVGVMIHNALKTLRQRYGQASKDFLPFTPRIVT
jgi:RNA polymerase sigma factor (sigma-70 family)